MSKNTKIVLGILAAVVILGGCYAYWQYRESTRSGAEQTEVTTLPSGTDQSDTALESDLGSIDAQINAVGSDNADAKASIQDVVAQ
ncbi:MAG: hypothetical protein AAB472_00895 [Patescibacteria group bacterium]